MLLVCTGLLGFTIRFPPILFGVTSLKSLTEGVLFISRVGEIIRSSAFFADYSFQVSISMSFLAALFLIA